MRIVLVTDSTAVLPPEKLARHGIYVVPLVITWDGEEYFDGVDMTYADFAARATNGVTPKTSAPSPGQYQTAYERALEHADALFVVTPPAELSVTFSNATLAARAVDAERIDVFDARSAATGAGLVVLETARTAEASGDRAAVRERAEFVAGAVRLVATLERLDYLRRSGRVPAVAALATEALHLHPLFRFVQGKPTVMGTARGGRRAADRLVDAFEESRPAGGRAHVSIMHASREDHAAELQARIREIEPGAETFVVEVSAGMAAHLGPGVLGLAWFWDRPAPDAPPPPEPPIH